MGLCGHHPWAAFHGGPGIQVLAFSSGSWPCQASFSGSLHRLPEALSWWISQEEGWSLWASSWSGYVPAQVHKRNEGASSKANSWAVCGLRWVQSFYKRLRQCLQKYGSTAYRTCCTTLLSENQLGRKATTTISIRKQDSLPDGEKRFNKIRHSLLRVQRSGIVNVQRFAQAWKIKE